MNKRNELISMYPDHTDLTYRSESLKKEITDYNCSFLQKAKTGLFCCVHICYSVLLFFLKKGCGSSINKKGQAGFCVELCKIDIKEFPLFDWSMNDGIEPVAYNECRFWLISECAYWYAVEYEKKYYAFDVREMCSKTGLQKPEETLNIKEKYIWLSTFAKQLENSFYFFDVEKSVKR